MTSLQTTTGNSATNPPPKFVIVQPPNPSPIVIATNAGVVKFNQQSSSGSSTTTHVSTTRIHLKYNNISVSILVISVETYRLHFRLVGRLHSGRPHGRRSGRSFAPRIEYFQHYLQLHILYPNTTTNRHLDASRRIVGKIYTLSINV